MIDYKGIGPVTQKYIGEGEGILRILRKIAHIVGTLILSFRHSKICVIQTTKILAKLTHKKLHDTSTLTVWWVNQHCWSMNFEKSYLKQLPTTHLDNKTKRMVNSTLFRFFLCLSFSFHPTVFFSEWCCFKDRQLICHFQFPFYFLTMSKYTIEYVSFCINTVAVVLNTTLMVYHYRAIYQDFYTSERKSVSHRRNQPEITFPYKLVAWCTAGNILCAEIFSLGILYSV